jgi:hypothetical protein
MPSPRRTGSIYFVQGNTDYQELFRPANMETIEAAIKIVKNPISYVSGVQRKSLEWY